MFSDLSPESFETYFYLSGLNERTWALSTEDLINWTTSYLHFKQALEVFELTPEITQHYLKQFGEYRERLAKDLSKQGFLEARLPKEMREKIAQENLIWHSSNKRWRRILKRYANHS